MSESVRGQSALEYLSTYAWAILILAIILGLLLYFVSLPQSLVQNSCTVNSGVSCQDIVLGSNASTTVVTVRMINQLNTQIQNPRITINFDNANLSGACTPISANPGKQLTCTVNLNTVKKEGTFLAGAFYITVGNCGLSANYLSTKTCINPTAQTFTGTFSGHTESPIPYLAYVANYGGGAVNVINTATGTVVNTISLGGHPSLLAISPDGTRLAVMNPGTNSVSIINATNDVVIKTVVVGPSLTGLAYSPDGSKIIALNELAGTGIANIISTVNYTVKSIQVGSDPFADAFTPDGTKAYIVNNANGGVATVSVINLASYTVTKTINLNNNDGPYDIAMAPQGTQAFVSFEAGTSTGLAVINVTNDVLTNTINVQAYPYDVAVTPDGSKAFVTDGGSGGSYTKVSSVVTSNAAVALISVGTNPHGLAVTPDGSRVFVVNEGSGTVSVINTTTLTVVATVSVGSSPQYITITPDSQKALVTNFGSGTVTLINTNTYGTTTISGFSQPAGVVTTVYSLDSAPSS